MSPSQTPTADDLEQWKHAWVQYQRLVNSWYVRIAKASGMVKLPKLQLDSLTADQPETLSQQIKQQTSQLQQAVAWLAAQPALRWKFTLTNLLKFGLLTLKFLATAVVRAPFLIRLDWLILRTYWHSQANTPASDLQLTARQQTLDGVSIIIPTWNKKQLLLDCLLHLDKVLTGKPLPVPVEIIVVDNGSQDGSAKAVKNLQLTTPLRLIALPENQGFASAVNLAVDRASYNYVYLMNNDMFAYGSCFVNLLKVASQMLARKERFFALASQVIFPRNKPRQESGLTYWQPGFGRLYLAHVVNSQLLHGVQPTAWAGGGSSLFNKHLFVQLGRFDQKLYQPMYVEDADLGFSAWRKGWPSYFVASSRIKHLHQTSSRSSQFDPEFVMHKNWLALELKQIMSVKQLGRFVCQTNLLALVNKRHYRLLQALVPQLPAIQQARIQLQKYSDKYGEQLFDFARFSLTDLLSDYGAR